MIGDLVLARKKWAFAAILCVRSETTRGQKPHALTPWACARRIDAPSATPGDVARWRRASAQDGGSRRVGVGRLSAPRQVIGLIEYGLSGRRPVRYEMVHRRNGRAAAQCPRRT